MTAIFDVTHWPSPAKLNLFLYITGRNLRNYHNLQTLFQFLDHGDQLTIQANKSGVIALQPELPSVATQDNLIWKAANLLQQYTKVPFGANIKIDKKLPMGGGIGGGSSNAATVLVALNFLWRCQLSTHELAQLGLQLGADVPVFVEGFAAFAEGVGEQLTPVLPQEKWYVVIHPEVAISTAEIFSHPNLPRNTPIRSWSEINSAPYTNDCQKIVTTLYPEVDKQLSWLLQYAPSRLTGTGSCVFAEFEHQSAAQAVFEQLDENQSAFMTKGVNRSPLHLTLAQYQQAYSQP